MVLVSVPHPPQAGSARNGHLWVPPSSSQAGRQLDHSFHYSDTWQLVINTGTTNITFLMVFLIQNTQNRDARAINLKLDELIHAIDNAGNQMMNIEKLSDRELDLIHVKYEKLRAECVDDPCEAELEVE
jgi:low affinity Fe/Cu permease